MLEKPRETPPKQAVKGVGKLRSPWDLPVQFLRGVGEKLALGLGKAGIENLWDLLLTLPKSYEDRRRLHGPMDLLRLYHANQAVFLRVQIIRFVQAGGGGHGGRRWLEAHCRIFDPLANAFGEYPLTLIWFHQAGMGIQKSFGPDDELIVRGKLTEFRGRFRISHPEVTFAGKELPPWEFGSLVPVYREAQGLSTRFFRKVVHQALAREEIHSIPEILPPHLIARVRLPSFRQALSEIHFPQTWEPSEDLKPGGPFLARLVFEELFLMALALHMRRSEWKKKSLQHQEKIPKITTPVQALNAWKKSLPFVLTDDQEKALSEIFEDISLKEGPLPMHRLVQGDVGSGKTIVAFLSALATMELGYQAAMMAPTEILADQHYLNFIKLFPEKAHEVLILKGALTQKRKKEVREKLQSGEVRFVIGTQALLTDDTLFEKLGLVVVDEQHRFGVEQRLGLKEAEGPTIPHLLVMTATPIPRSLALTLYGDLSMSVIKNKPKGRIPIQTHLIKAKQRMKLMERVGRFVNVDNRQVYIVYPLVEESEEVDLKDVTSAVAEWKAALPGVEIGLLHGRMKAKEKDEAMKAFKDGRTQILLSTTVIEVGVDVPNASVIIIEHAERFGLSQLHQLRGRVGRGSIESFCILVGPDNPGEEAKARLEILVESDDGFVIAEKDLELRGPGEFLGRRQSGLPGFRVAHILRDIEWMNLARDEARKILDADPLLEKQEHRALKTYIQRWWQGRMELTLSG